MKGGVSPLIGPGIPTTDEKAPYCLSPTQCSRSFVQVPGKTVVFYGRGRGFQVVLCQSERSTLDEGLAWSLASSPSPRRRGGISSWQHVVCSAAFGVPRLNRAQPLYRSYRGTCTYDIVFTRRMFFSLFAFLCSCFLVDVVRCRAACHRLQVACLTRTH